MQDIQSLIVVMQSWRVLILPCLHEDIVCHSKQSCFSAMKMTKAGLKFVEDIVSFNDL